MTTARADPSFSSPPERLWLNGVEEEIKSQGRMRTCIDEMRKLRKGLEDKDDKLPKVSEREDSGVKISFQIVTPPLSPLCSSSRRMASASARRTTFPQLLASPRPLLDLQL